MRAITITYLEIRSAEAVRPKRCADPLFTVREATVKQWQFNRFLYDLVGRDWCWRDKTNWTDDQWRNYAESAELSTFAAYYDGSVAGYYERRWDHCGGLQIAILGLAPKFVGRGFGGALLTSALEEAWRLQPTRVWLHTCNLDHPAALPNYQARGMTVFKMENRITD